MKQGESGVQIAVDIPKNDFVFSDEEIKADEKSSGEISESAETNELPEEKAEKDESSEKVKKPRRGGFQKKLAQRDAKIAELEAQLTKRNSEQSDNAPAQKPVPESYHTYDEYIEALTDFKAEHKAREEVEKKLKARDNDSKEEMLRKEMRAKAETYETRAEEARKTLKNFDEVLESYDGPFTAQMQQAVLASDVGPEVTYYLASHPEETAKIAGMTIVDMHRAIGRIEARVEYGKQQGKAAVKVTQAPPPITPVGKGKSGTFDPESATPEEYMAWRRKSQRS